VSAADLDLARRILAGEERAFDVFFEESFSGLYRFALRRVGGNADAAEEVAQATLCKAIRKLATYRGEAALFTWLCTICRHEISAHFERARRLPVTVDWFENDAEVVAALESLRSGIVDGPEEALRRDELAQHVHVVLDRLPSRYADALEWKYVDGLPVKVIAERLGLTPKAAESLLTRARSAFRDGISMLLPQQFVWRRAETGRS
jgi:RNA polymerase sigma-70 factor (ECF subfamily)